MRFRDLTMAENIAQTIQKAIQDLVAPNLRELKAMVAGNQKQNDLHFGVHDDKFAALQKQIDQRFDAQDAKTEFMFRALMSAIAEVKAQNNLTTQQAIAALSERVAVLESHRQ